MQSTASDLREDVIKKVTFRLIPFVGLNDLSNTPDRRICWQAKTRPQLVVGELLESDLVGALLLESDASQPRCSGIEVLNGCTQGISLLRVGKELELQGQFHINRYIGILSQSQGEKGCWPARPTFNSPVG